MVGAAEERADLAGGRVGIGRRRRARRGASRRRSSSGAAVRESLEGLAIDVGDQVAEAIDAQHRRRDARPSSTSRLRDVEPLNAPAGRPSADSSMPLASHAAAGAKRSRPSNVRLTVGRAYRRSVSSTTRFGGHLVEDRRQHAVVGRDEPIVAGVGGDAAAGRADAGIDDDEKDRAGWKVPVGGGELERAASTSCGGTSCVMSTSVDVGTDAERRRPSSCRRSDRGCRSRSAAR